MWLVDCAYKYERRGQALFWGARGGEGEGGLLLNMSLGLSKKGGSHLLTVTSGLSAKSQKQNSAQVCSLLHQLQLGHGRRCTDRYRYRYAVPRTADTGYR